MASQSQTRRPPENEDVLRALADSTRQKLLQLLIQHELSVSELVEVLKLPQSTVSRHLKVLREAGLVRDRREGTTVLYCIGAANGAPSDLPEVLLGWLGRQSVPAAMAGRLERVLKRRRDQAAGFFDRLGSRWDQLRSESFGDAFAFEAMVCLLPRDWTVADIGTGTGWLLPVLAGHFKRVMAVDPAAAMLACARQRINEAGTTNVDFEQGDLGRLPIPDATCDLAIACLVLHHVARPSEALAELHRVVRPGGRVLVVEQQAHENQAFYDTMQDMWWGFDPQELSQQMQAAGFSRVRPARLQRGDGKASAEAPALFAVTAERPAHREGEPGEPPGEPDWEGEPPGEPRSRSNV
jgi:ArsR family transcriptional regulator